MGKKKWENVIISKTDNIPGKKIIKTIDKVGLKIETTSLAPYLLIQKKLRKIAYKLGANAVIGARAEYRDSMDSMVLYGTAVIIEDDG